MLALPYTILNTIPYVPIHYTTLYDILYYPILYTLHTQYSPNCETACWLYPIQFHTIPFARYTIHYTPHTILPYTKHYTLYYPILNTKNTDSLQIVRQPVGFTLYCFTLYTIHYTTLHYTLCTIHCTVYILGLAMPQFLLMRIDAHQMRIDAHIPHQ